jgi:pimeloyl-ACP methyl ester carboxylesterase
VIVFTSDHGEGFDREFDRVHHAGQLYANVIRVPVLVHVPGVSPREEPTPVSLIDVMPSILEWSGTEIPAGLDGRSFTGLLSDAPVAQPPRTLFAMEHAYWRNKGRRESVEKISSMPVSAAAIRGDRWCIRGGRSGTEANLGPGSTEELYDMTKDPDQRQVLSTQPNPLSLEQSVGGQLGQRTQTGPRGKNQALDDELRGTALWRGDVVRYSASTADDLLNSVYTKADAAMVRLHQVSPVTAVHKGMAPFLIIHGEKDELVSTKQSHLLSAWLNVAGVQNELVIVKDAPHFGPMFDTDEVRNKVIAFLKKQLQ